MNIKKQIYLTVSMKHLSQRHRKFKSLSFSHGEMAVISHSVFDHSVGCFFYNEISWNLQLVRINMQSIQFC